MSAGGVQKRRHLLAAEGDKDELIPVPEDFAERMLHYNASAIEIREAIKLVPEEMRRSVIDGHLGGRVRIVESMTDVADILKRADSSVTDEYIEQLAGALVSITDDAGNPIGDGIFVALTTYDRVSGERALVKNTAGVFRHELSHAVDKLVGVDGILLSDSDMFTHLYDLDRAELALRLTASEVSKLEEIHLLNPDNCRQELLAQVLASKMGGCTFPEEQALIEKAFPRIWNLVFRRD